MNKQKYLGLSLIIILIIFWFFLTPNNKYIQVTNNIFVKKNWLNKQTAWFKIYSSQMEYEEINYKAHCETQSIYLLEIKTYKKNKLVNKEINNKNISAHYLGYVNGDIIFKTLCAQEN